GALLEVHRAEVLLLCPRADELPTFREVDPAVDAIELERRAAHPLLPGGVQVAQLADERLTSQEAVEVLVPLGETCLSRRHRGLGDRLGLSQDFWHLLLDRRSGSA